MTHTSRIANRLADVLRFDGEAVTARAFTHEAEDYIITEGTGEGPGVFAYLAADVETFLERHPERADYSADFCAEVSPVETVELAWALAAEDKALLCAGTCDAVLLDASEWRAPITEAEAALSAAALRFFETHETGDEYAAIMMGGDNFSAPPLGWVLDLGDGRMAAAIGDTSAVLVSRSAPRG
jgi:hypothetical protein